MRILSKVSIALVFVLAGVLFFHNLTSVNVDIGRHIKLGEIIWQTKSIPDTNLFSFTAPTFPFINHHWLSEVIFYGVFNMGASWLSGLQLIIIFKVLVLLAAYFILYLTVKRHSIIAVALSFIVSVFVFSARTEPRPEIFSYLIFAAYLLIICRVKLTASDVRRTSDAEILSWLWLLPVLQVFWVNLHIYFILGPILYLFFMTDEMVNKKVWKVKNWKLIENWKLKIGIFVLVILANFANPNFIAGALYPLKVLGNYGYSVAENSSLFFLARYFGHWAPQDKLFLISLFIVAASFILSFWFRGRTSRHSRPDLISTRIFDLLLVVMTVILSFKMQRNIPLYALSLWPVMAENFDLRGQVPFLQQKRYLTPLLHACVIFLLVASIYFVASGKFYNWLNSPKTFGLEVSRAAQNGIDFIKANKIQGPVFNNFDIGSYLVWQLFPDQKVFVDGRPEAYPASFFQDVYKPMQSEADAWKQKADEHKINYAFFAHTDMTEWANEFLIRISKDKRWSMVFLNDAVVVFLKNNDVNNLTVNDHKITEENINERVSSVLEKLNKNDNNAFVNFGNVLYRFRWFEASAKVYETLIVNHPGRPYGYQGAGYAYVAMNDLATQEKAAQNLEKAISLGLKTFNNYFTLGIIKANLGNLFEAEKNIKKALEINPDNKNAQQVLETIGTKLYIR